VRPAADGVRIGGEGIGGDSIGKILYAKMNAKMSLLLP
jgi:hypothetical protein